MTKRLQVTLCVVLQLSLVACLSRAEVDLIIRNVAILDIRTGSYTHKHQVIVKDGVIVAIVPEAHGVAFVARQTVDGGGGFLIPALGDVHVHLQTFSELKSYVRYGVTAVFNMSGAPIHLQMRAKTANGSILGPRIFTVGPTIDGRRPTNPLFTTVTTDNAGEVTRWIQAQGYDAIKVYQQIEKDTLAEVIASAADLGMITTGHVSRLAGVEGTLDAGLRYIAHGEELTFPFYDQASRTYDRRSVSALTKRLGKHGAAVTPMIGYLENIPAQAVDLDRYLSQEPMALVPAAVKQSWDELQGYYANRNEPEVFVRQISELASFVAELSKALQDGAVPLLLGTDASFGGAIPGYSVHLELQSLVDAGLTPLQALQSATVNIGHFLNSAGVLEVGWGQVKAGFAADFLILAGDPINDVSATLGIKGVSVRGQWHSLSDLENVEKDLRKQQEALLPLVRNAEALIVNGDAIAFRKLAEDYLGRGGLDALVLPDNCIFLGYRHFYGGRRGLAGDIYESCALMRPDHAPLWIHIARSREAVGDVAGAIEAYEKAQSLNPWYGDPATALAELRNQS